MNNVHFPHKIQSTVLIHYCYLAVKRVVNKNKEHSSKLYPMKEKSSFQNGALC